MRRTKLAEVLLLQLQLFTVRRMRYSTQEVEGFQKSEIFHAIQKERTVFI